MHFSLADMILDLLQNSIEADSRTVELLLDQDSTRLRVIIGDDGRGMSEQELSRAFDPFYTDGKKHKARKVGLGLPFLQQTLEMTGGHFSIESEPGKGTRLEMEFALDHYDTPPIGDLVSLFSNAFCYDGDYELIIKRKRKSDREDDEYRLSRLELMDVLGDLESVGSRSLLREFISSQED